MSSSVIKLDSELDPQKLEALLSFNEKINLINELLDTGFPIKKDDQDNDIYDEKGNPVLEWLPISKTAFCEWHLSFNKKTSGLRNSKSFCETYGSKYSNIRSSGVDTLNTKKEFLNVVNTLVKTVKEQIKAQKNVKTTKQLIANLEAKLAVEERRREMSEHAHVIEIAKNKKTRTELVTANKKLESLSYMYEMLEEKHQEVVAKQADRIIELKKQVEALTEKIVKLSTDDTTVVSIKKRRKK